MADIFDIYSYAIEEYGTLSESTEFDINYYELFESLDISSITVSETYTNPNISSDIGNYENYSFESNATPFDTILESIEYGTLSESTAFDVNYYQLYEGEIALSYFDDLYNDIIISPYKIELDLLTSAITYSVIVWNSYLDTTAILSDVNIIGGVGIEIDGDTSTSFTPLQYKTYSVTITMSGNANIDNEIEFDFSNVINPVNLMITGMRAVLITGSSTDEFEIIPELPLTENLEWLTDIIRAVDGTEQRIALRGELPRTSYIFNFVFENLDALRLFHGNLLSVQGRLWIPEFQYATITTQISETDTDVIYVDTSKTDIRANELILVQIGTNLNLLNVLEVYETYIVVDYTLTEDIAVGKYIIPGSSCLLDDEQTLKRYTVDNAGEIEITANSTRQRTSFSRPSADVTLETYQDLPILTKRPIYDDLFENIFYTGQESYDNSVGLQDLTTRWQYTREGGNRYFKLNRLNTFEDIDWWRAFLTECRGQAKTFFMSSWRPDFEIYQTPEEEATTLYLTGTDYVNKYYPALTHRYFEIETAGGTIYRAITAAEISDSTSLITLDEALPAGEDYTTIEKISLFLPCRLGSDTVKLEHYENESFLTLSFRTAEI